MDLRVRGRPAVFVETAGAGLASAPSRLSPQRWAVGTRRGQGTPVEPRRGMAGDGKMAETDCRGTPAQ